MTTEQTASRLFLEAHFVYGLRPFVLQELRQYLNSNLILLPTNDPETIRYGFINDLSLLYHFRTVTAFHLGCQYAISRPKALLGHQHFQQLLEQIVLVRHAHQHSPFRSFRIEAAGSDSTIFRRLRQQIASATALVDDPEAGELVIRVFPTQGRSSQWTVLCRLAPRPLSARAWRVADFPGALNATIAAAMILLSEPQPTDRVLNLMCGSGTLLVERLLLAHAAIAVGCDSNPSALTAAQLNINAADLTNKIVLLHEDATQLSFPPNSFDRLLCDLPWGQLVGDHAKNEFLYPLLLQEAARVAVPGARFVLITTEARLLEKMIAQQAHLWRLCKAIKVKFKNLHPRIYLLRRNVVGGGN